MENNRINLTSAEWNVMECLWEKASITGREATDMLEERMGWNRSTTLTLLRRLEEKGAIASDSKGAKKMFRPIVTREDAALQETEDFLDRVYNGSISLMLSAMTRKQALSKEEIDELYAMLKDMEGGN
ncbi:MAG: BlaI/MecI/CopY family transcriptional regulator [Agathobacter sp.]|nr:BlaI/MecI/CopY family transcriptional regulator [Agathobacter sp.]